MPAMKAEAALTPQGSWLTGHRDPAVCRYRSQKLDPKNTLVPVTEWILGNVCVLVNVSDDKHIYKSYDCRQKSTLIAIVCDIFYIQ